MNIFIKTSLLLALFTSLSFAGETVSKTEQTFTLLHKNGVSTPYVLSQNEFAVTQTEKKAPVNIDLVKKLTEHPSYTLFSVKRKKISSTASQADMNQVGNVFYKNGVEDETHRYISTGQIIVTFNSKQKIDVKAFAKEHQLVYLKTVGPAQMQTVLFANHSQKNDIELASSLIKSPTVKEVKPNWILPLKLF